MSGASYLAFFGLMVMVVLYALDRWWPAPLGPPPDGVRNCRALHRH